MDGPPVDKPQSGRSHAPIKSRRGSSGGGGRHNACWSDLTIDSQAKSQPAANPRPNPVGRTPPPGNPDNDTEARLLASAGRLSLRLDDDDQALPEATIAATAAVWDDALLSGRTAKVEMSGDHRTLAEAVLAALCETLR